MILKEGVPLSVLKNLNHLLLSLTEHLVNFSLTVFLFAQTSFLASSTISEGRKEVLRMSEYVKWCSSVEDLALGNCFKVILRTLRYSAKKVSRIFCFFDVNGRKLSNIVLFMDSPIFSLYLKYLNFTPIPPLPHGRGFLGGD